MEKQYESFKCRVLSKTSGSNNHIVRNYLALVYSYLDLEIEAKKEESYGSCTSEINNAKVLEYIETREKAEQEIYKLTKISPTVWKI